jgi:hypothetical protein
LEISVANYNVIYDKSYTLETITAELITVDAEINTVFEQLGVLNISTDSEQFTELPFIVAWEPDRAVTPDPAYDWHQFRIVSPTLPMREVYYPLSYGDNVSVYLVDSGVDTTHDEFSTATIDHVYSYDNTFEDDSGHGTGVASLIVGKTIGVSPKAILKNVKIPLNTTTNIAVLLEAFDTIMADKTDPVSVINCSWTIPKSQILDTKLLEMQAAGFIIVAAAGNLLAAADNYSPVGLDTVLGVGASDAYDRVITWGPNRGSNWGPEVDITAPGIDVPVAVRSGGIADASGTSLAAGITSAVVAQYIHRHPEQSAQKVQNLVLAKANPEVLFRNESIYGTTPNLLLLTQVETSFLNNFINIHDCKKDEVTVIQLEPNTNVVGSVELVPFPRQNSNKVLPPWVSFDQTTYTLTATPLHDIEPRRHIVYIKLYNLSGNHIVTRTIILNVYATSPDENTTLEAYYYEHAADGSIFISPATCQIYSCDFFPFDDCRNNFSSKSNPCGCAFPSYTFCVSGF